MFDAEALVIEAISRHTGVDPGDFSMKTKLRDSRAIRPEELEEVIEDIEEALGQKVAADVAGIVSVGDLVALVEKLGPS